MTRRSFTLAGLAACVLCSGCASFEGPPLDDLDFEAAVLAEEDALPVELVRVPEPLPLPGQMQRIEEVVEARGEPRTPAGRIDAANEAARMQPSLDGYVNAVQIYPYVAGALYQLYAAPEKVTDIVLEPGEELISVSAGDTVRWVVGDTLSGSADGDQVHILVKPIQPNLQTNLVVTTDRRAYHLEMRSFRETYMASISWSYPQDAFGRRVARNDRARDRRGRTVEDRFAVDQLQFRYRIDGDRPAWRPVRAFDDGAKVYIQFPEHLAQAEAPPLFVIGADGEAELVNYRVRGSYYVVDRLFAAAELRLGEDDQDVVRIVRVEPRSGGFMRRS